MARRSWNLFRVLRLIAGLAIAGFGISNGQAGIIAAGALFSTMALLNIGGCGSAGCAPRIENNASQQKKKIDYEKLDLPQ
jgi:hypothetical protein